MPRTPSWPPGAEASSIVIATLRSPVTGLTRVTLLPVRSVTHNMLSGPQATSHGPANPAVTTLFENCFVPRRTESGPSWAETAATDKQASAGIRKENRFI